MGIILCTLSHVLHMSEKFVLCLAALGIVSCLVFTFTMMLVLGIGLGYNYCFVDFKTRHKYVPGYYQYTILPATSTRRRPIKYYPPYPTLYPPPNEWYQIHPRRENIQNESGILDIDPNDMNNTFLEKLNIDLSSLELLNETKYNESIQDFFQDYYDKNNENTTTSYKEINTTVSSENVTGKTSNYTKTILHINGLNLFALLAKLKSENKNYTVKIETD